jgi:hypothetical protein
VLATLGPEGFLRYADFLSRISTGGFLEPEFVFVVVDRMVTFVLVYVTEMEYRDGPKVLPAVFARNIVGVPRSFESHDGKAIVLGAYFRERCVAFGTCYLVILLCDRPLDHQEIVARILSLRDRFDSAYLCQQNTSQAPNCEPAA